LGMIFASSSQPTGSQMIPNTSWLAIGFRNRAQFDPNKNLQPKKCGKGKCFTASGCLCSTVERWTAKTAGSCLAWHPPIAAGFIEMRGFQVPLRLLMDPWHSKKTIPMFAGSIPMLGKHTKANMCIKINPCKNPRTIIYKFWILPMRVRMVIAPKGINQYGFWGGIVRGEGVGHYNDPCYSNMCGFRAWRFMMSVFFWGFTDFWCVSVRECLCRCILWVQLPLDIPAILLDEKEKKYRKLGKPHFQWPI